MWKCDRILEFVNTMYHVDLAAFLGIQVIYQYFLTERELHKAQSSFIKDTFFLFLHFMTAFPQVK